MALGKDFWFFKKKMKRRKDKEVVGRRDHYWHSRFLKVAYGLTDANKIIPGKAVFYVETSVGLLRLLDNPCKPK